MKVTAAKRLPPIDDRIREAFAEYFETLALLREYAAQRRHPIELAILACARLDSLANLATSRKEQEDTFPYFMEQYSGQKHLLQKVAIPNLYSYLARYHEILPGIIESPGRITQYNKEDRRFLEVIAKSDLPATEEAIASFLRWLRRTIQTRYRATASQRRSKPMLDGQKPFISYLEEAASARASGSYKTAVTAMRPLVRAFTLSSVFYREFRCPLIHEFGFFTYSNRFFRDPDIYWRTIRHAYDDIVYLDLQFSASWLIQILHSCLNNYIARLINSKKLPPELFIEICDLFAELDFLDQDLIGESRRISLQIGR